MFLVDDRATLGRREAQLLARLEERRDAPPPIMANVGNLPAISQSLPEDHAMKFIQRSRKAKATAQRRHQARRV